MGGITTADCIRCGGNTCRDTDSIQETSLGPKRFLDFAGESTTRPLDFII